MIDSFEYTGVWYIPGDRENSLHGTLKFKQGESCTLEVYGSFSKNSYYSSEVGISLIHGLTTTSQRINLYDCQLVRMPGLTLVSDGEIGTPAHLYSVQFIIDGEHIDDLTQIAFQEIACEMSHLDSWIGINGFQHLKGLEGFNIGHIVPAPINFEINERLSGQFYFTHSLSINGELERSATLAQNVELRIQSRTEMPLKKLIRKIRCFQNFLILALYSRTYPTSMTVTSDRYRTETDDGNTSTKWLKVYWIISSYRKIEKSIAPFQMLFSYGMVKNDFATIMKTWYQNYEHLKPAYNLVFDKFYNSHQYDENTFLNLAQAAETFHNRAHDRTNWPKEDFKRMKTEILNSVPAEHQDWLKSQLHFANQLNLHSRLTELVELYSNSSLDNYIGDKASFITDVKRSRNYYTHYSEESEKNAAKDIDLFYLSVKLQALLTCAFLIHVGLKKELLEASIQRNKSIFPIIAYSL